MRRVICVIVIIAICYLLQVSVAPAIAFASIVPNIMVVVASAFGFMRGKKEGLVIGFFCGFLLDITGGGVLGFYALLYMYVGLANGAFRKFFYPEDVKLPLALIAASDLSGNFIIYFFRFLFRGRFDFRYYFMHIMLPELVYTMLVAIFLYFVILKVNQRLEAAERKRASKFV